MRGLVIVKGSDRVHAACLKERFRGREAQL